MSGERRFLAIEDDRTDASLQSPDARDSYLAAIVSGPVSMSRLDWLLRHLTAVIESDRPVFSRSQ